MSQLRRVLPMIGSPRTPRPDMRAVREKSSSRASRTVVPLFPHDTPLDADGRPQTANIFADLADWKPADARLRRARERMRRLMPGADAPVIDNLFAEECPDVPEAVFADRLAVFQSRRRPLEAAREQIVAYHDEHARNGIGDVLPFPTPRVAAGIFGMLTLIHFGASQSF